jgi:hypothetical protein
MANRTWIGGAKAVAQVAQIIVNTATSTDVYNLVLTDELGGTATVGFTAGVSDTTTTIATGIFNAAAASVDARFLAVNVTNPSAGKVVITAASPGVPFKPSLSGTGSGLMTLTTTNASSGPNDFNCPGNYVENIVPVGGDSLTITGNSAILYGVITGLSFAKFLAAPGCSSAMGLPGRNFQFTVTGTFDWYSTGVSYIDLQASGIAPNIWQTASASAPAFGLNLIGTAMTTLSIYSGSVGLAPFAGQLSTATTVQLTGQNSGGARVGLSSGCTVTNMLASGGTVNVACALTLLKASNGTVTTTGTVAITTITNNGATIYPNNAPAAGAAVGTLNQNSGTTNFQTSNQARTVTTPLFYGGTLKWDPNVVTMTTPPAPTSTGPQSWSLTAP